MNGRSRRPNRSACAAAFPLLFALAACTTSPQIITTPTDTRGSPAPAIVVVDDQPESHPHAGLQRADVVFEYLTEGEISRFTALYFHPSGPDRIEPVRSIRIVTLRIQRAYHGLIVASGASNHVMQLLDAAKARFVTEQSDGSRYFERDPNRDAPHNLYTTEDQLRAAVQRSRLRISYPLPYSSGAPLPNGIPANRINFNQTRSHAVTYLYSQSQHAYEYEWAWNGSFQGPETDSNNANRPLMVTNVVIVFVPHRTLDYVEDSTGAHGMDFDLQGRGDALVFTQGRRITATWDWSNPDAPLRLLDSNGSPVALRAGLTWIHLVDPDTAVAVS